MRVRLVIRRSQVRSLLFWQHSFMEIDQEIFFMVILSLLLIQEGHLSVSGKRMGVNTDQLLRRQSLPRKKCGQVN